MSSTLVDGIRHQLDTAAPPGCASADSQGVDIVEVTHRYDSGEGPVQALLPLDLHVAAGAFVAILGPSGCGKTTLLRILCGLLEPTDGRVRLGGVTPAAARQQRAIGWLAQDDGLLPWRRVLDNVGLPLRLAGERALADTAAQDMLARVGLPDSARRYPHELSGGMRQRVALARSLLARPPFLLLDEPFAHLDELTRERLGDLLLELRAERVAAPPTTVLVTHSVTEAVRLADRIVVLSASPGRVVADVRVPLEQPRAEDQPGFGALVRQLKRHFVTLR
ncbi:MAG TPA: ABC transporter ATP-binding protein [Chloroflexota bacterium]|jgi:NitT/TauT family transport system ATP-binding protein|nr:ABC transporter ATP-binding protein [Chloroflexota bacterium]